MNKLPILSLIFFSLVGMADISLAMDLAITNNFTEKDILKFFPTQNKETILKLPNIRIWIKSDKEQKYYSLDNSGDLSKHIKDGHCQLWWDEDKYFVQPVDLIQNVFTQKAIRIRPLTSTDLLAVTTRGNSVVIGLEDKSYILKNTNPGYVPHIIPFHTINIIPTVFEGKEQMALQIQEGENAHNAFFHLENLSEELTTMVGTLHGHLGNKLLIDIHNEQEQLITTIGLLMQPDLFTKVRDLLETKSVFAHYKTMEDGKETSNIVMITNKSDKCKNPTAEDNLQAIETASSKEDKELLNNRKQIRQISNEINEIYELASLAKEENNTVYQAVKVKRIDTTKYKIIFYIAGQKYIRVVKDLEAYKTYYIAINDIIDSAYVSFKCPSDLSLPLNIWDYMIKKGKPKLDHNPIKNPLEKEIIELLDIESIHEITKRYTIKSFSNKDPWLHTIWGYIEEDATNPSTKILILQDNNNRISIELNKYIAHQIVNLITDNQSEKHLVLQNEQGIDRLIIKCSLRKPPALESDRQELKDKTQTLATPKQPDLEKPQDKIPAPTYFNSLLKKLIQYRYPIGGVVSISITASLLYYLHAMYNS